jgi:alkylhydroperoxidase family enzyme
MDTRAAEQLSPLGLSEDLYAHVADWRTYPGYSEAERIAIEFAEKFALEHTRLDDAFFSRMRRLYTDGEIMDIAICVGTWLMLGRITMIMDVAVSCPLRLGLQEPAA